MMRQDNASVHQDSADQTASLVNIIFNLSFIYNNVWLRRDKRNTYTDSHCSLEMVPGLQGVYKCLK